MPEDADPWAARAFDALELPVEDDDADPISEFENVNVKVGDMAAVTINRKGVVLTVHGVLKYHLGGLPNRNGTQLWRCAKNRSKGGKCRAVLWTEHYDRPNGPEQTLTVLKVRIF